MTIDTLAYCKELEAGGLDRHTAEIEVAALAKHVLPDLVNKSDLTTAIEGAVHTITVRFFTYMLAITGIMNAILFALLHFLPPNR
jgi:hypothetical protein